MSRGPYKEVEWRTLSLVFLCYAVWMAASVWVAEHSVLVAAIILSFAIAFHSSLQHEVIHGHPLPSRFWSEFLVFPAVGLLIPYQRFRATHLKHHIDPNLTDPYEDPETNYLDPEVWERLPGFVKPLLRFNNSLFGRLLIGPAISQVAFMRDDWRLFWSGERRDIAIGWLLHVFGAILVLLWVWALSPVPVWLYVVAAYLGLSLLKVRTFLEHRAHKLPRGRTVIVNDRGFWALLFLNNNFHLVHHMHPFEPWYRLPALFDRNRERFLARNEGYLFQTYTQIFTKYLFKPKDPVPHPLWRKG